MDVSILKYKEDLIKLALGFINQEDLVLVQDIIFCGSRAGDWYEEDSDIDLAVSLDKDIHYSPSDCWFTAKYLNYSVDVFIKNSEEIHTWRGLKSPYYSLYTDKYYPGNAEDIEWLRTHKPILRERKKERRGQL
jgi:predicted nucleotidyltransferase